MFHPTVWGLSDKLREGSRDRFTNATAMTGGTVLWGQPQSRYSYSASVSVAVEDAAVGGRVT